MSGGFAAEVWPGSDASIRVEMLQRPNIHFATLQCGDSLSSSACRSEGRDGGDPCHNGGAANCLLVEPRLLPGGGVDD